MNENETVQLYQSFRQQAEKAGKLDKFNAARRQQQRYAGNRPSWIYLLAQHAAYGGEGPYADAAPDVLEAAIREFHSDVLGGTQVECEICRHTFSLAAAGWMESQTGGDICPACVAAADAPEDPL